MTLLKISYLRLPKERKTQLWLLHKAKWFLLLAMEVRVQ